MPQAKFVEDAEILRAVARRTQTTVRGPSSYALVDVLNVSEKAIRKRLAALERAGYVTKGAAHGSGYVLTPAGAMQLTTSKGASARSCSKRWR